MEAHSYRATVLVLALAVLAFGGRASRAQTQSSEPAQERPATGTPAAGEVRPTMTEEERRAEMRQFISRQLERVRSQEVALQESLTLLDSGEPMMAVRRRAAAALGQRAEERGGANQMFMLRRRPGNGAEPGAEPGARADKPDPEALLAFGHELNAGMFDRLDRLRREDPDRFEQAFARIGPRLARMAEEKRRNPEAWDRRIRLWHLERDAWEVARNATSLPPDQQDQAKAHLVDLGNQMFDLRLRSMLHHVDELSNRLTRLRDEIARSTSRRDELVRERVEEFMTRASDPNGPGPPMLPGPMDDQAPEDRERPRPPRSGAEGNPPPPRGE